VSTARPRTRPAARPPAALQTPTDDRHQPAKQHWSIRRASNKLKTRWKVLRESTNPRESVFVANTWQHLPHYFAARNRRFTEFFDRYFHIHLLIVTKHELSLSPRNFRVKFGANPSTIYLVIVVTDTHTHTMQTIAGENIFPRFRGDNKE